MGAICLLTFNYRDLEGVNEAAVWYSGMVLCTALCSLFAIVLGPYVSICDALFYLKARRLGGEDYEEGESPALPGAPVCWREALW